jgi:hypothetical protein
LTGFTGDAGYFFAFPDERQKSVIPLRGSELTLRLQFHRGLFMGIKVSFPAMTGLNFLPSIHARGGSSTREGRNKIMIHKIL